MYVQLNFTCPKKMSNSSSAYVIGPGFKINFPYDKHKKNFNFYSLYILSYCVIWLSQEERGVTEGSETHGKALNFLANWFFHQVLLVESLVCWF